MRFVMCIRGIFLIRVDIMISIYTRKLYRRIYKSENRSAGASLDATRIRGTAASLSQFPSFRHRRTMVLRRTKARLFEDVRVRIRTEIYLHNLKQ